MASSSSSTEAIIAASSPSSPSSAQDSGFGDGITRLDSPIEAIPHLTDYVEFTRLDPLTTSTHPSTRSTTQQSSMLKRVRPSKLNYKPKYTKEATLRTTAELKVVAQGCDDWLKNYLGWQPKTEDPKTEEKDEGEATVVDGMGLGYQSKFTARETRETALEFQMMANDCDNWLKNYLGRHPKTGEMREKEKGEEDAMYVAGQGTRADDAIAAGTDGVDVNKADKDKDDGSAMDGDMNGADDCDGAVLNATKDGANEKEQGSEQATKGAGVGDRAALDTGKEGVDDEVKSIDKQVQVVDMVTETLKEVRLEGKAEDENVETAEKEA